MAKEVFSTEFRGKKISVEIGELAKQADGSCLVRMNDTVVLSTACASDQAKDTDFFPLTVTFEEKLYSVGKIPGSFLKREGRPSEHATLTARLIDRPIRPMFADGFRNEVQVVNTALSVDQNATVEMTAMLGSSIALCISDIPFNGPIAGVVVGYVDGEYIIDPSVEELERATITLNIAGTKDAINMVESGSKEVSEEEMLNAILFGHEAIKELCIFQEEIIAKVGKAKREIELYTIPTELEDAVKAVAKDRLVFAISEEGLTKLERYGKIDDIKNEVIASYEAKEYADEKEMKTTIKYVKEILDGIERDEVRRLISEDKVRPDGRKLDEIRPLSSDKDLLPRVHGSALFTRGETQVLSVVTLGALSDVQILDNLTPEEETKRFMHHYNFPPYSVGEIGRMGTPGRREIGHGALGERALSAIIPSQEEFPYVIRVVSEVLESNGSSSQASICASSMALMAAGVPIKGQLAGIAMGLITSGPIESGAPYTILTDIQGMEDHLGDMDFKVAGTKDGICAMQMDIKILGITAEIMEQALAQAKKARLEILDHMNANIDAPREKLSKYAPKTATFTIDPEKIRDVIGTGGKVINEIIEKCDNVKIDIEQDGRVVIYHMDYEAIDKARAMIENIVRVAEVGDIYDAKVTRIEPYGVFVELFPGTEALLHVSKIAWERVEHPNMVLKMNEIVQVKVIEIGEKGKISVSRKDLLPRPEKKDDKKEETK